MIGTTRMSMACVLGLAVVLGSCGERKEESPRPEAEVAPMPPAIRALRQGVETQMTALLRSIADAQERAHIDRGRYLTWDELRRSHFPDPIPANLQVRLVLLGEQAYEVEVVHEPSGVRCGMSAGTGTGRPSLYGAPRCR